MTALGPELASGWADRRPVVTNNTAVTNQSRSRISAKTEALKSQVRDSFEFWLRFILFSG